jgi:hypothetical protein
LSGGAGRRFIVGRAAAAPSDFCVTRVTARPSPGSSKKYWVAGKGLGDRPDGSARRRIMRPPKCSIDALLARDRAAQPEPQD